MLELLNISKSFPGVKALDNVSLRFNEAQVHALCGENGAGKTTLMNVIMGNIKPDAGKIIWKGSVLTIHNVEQAARIGLGIVYQERSLTDSLTVAENIFPDNQPLGKWGLISYRNLYRQTRQLLDELKMEDILPATKVEKLAVGQKQMVEIAKALAQKPSLLILDEPTASITHRETEILFSILRRLKKNGTAIIYISHRMGEIKTIADQVSVLKDGACQGTFHAATTSTEELITKMVGRHLQQATYATNRQPALAMQVNDLSGNKFQHVSFKLHKGEILGLAGLQGSGRTELARALFGDYPYTGNIRLGNGDKVKLLHPADAISRGIAYLPDDRKAEGLFINKSIADNIIAVTLRGGCYSGKAGEALAETLKKRMRIRATSVKQVVQKLSGGNQQKLVLAKWLQVSPEIFIMNEPTHGMDVGAKADIYEEMKKLAAAGKSILLVSSELTELLMLSDRVAIMYKGSIQGILYKAEASEELVTRMASGL